MSRVLSGLKTVVFGTVIAATATAAHAQAVLMQPRLSAMVANQIVGDTVAICAQRKYNVVAAIVDREGVRQAVLRGDNSPIHSMDNAYYKAYASASLTLGRNEDSTFAVAQRMAKIPRPASRLRSCPMSPTRGAASPSRCRE